MAIVNHDTREATFKIVYAGTPVSGKTTTLAYIHSRIDSGQRGDLLSLATSTDRTLYFDFMPVTAMLIQGYQTKFVIYTVPGQVHYNATRQLVLRGADGVVFVADSHPDRMEENVESARTLVKNLHENGLAVGQVPLVLQYNKRDLPEAAPRAHLDYLLNRLPQPLPAFETVASQGVNVFATLNAVSQMILHRFHGGSRRHGATAPPREHRGTRRRLMTGRALNLTADSLRSLRSSLAHVCHESDARYAAIVQDSGFVVADEGEASYHDLGETGALATGTFFAARALVRRLGEGNFAGLHYEGTERHFLLAPLGDDCLLLVVFTDQTRPAIVRACVRQVLSKLNAAVAALAADPAPVAGRPGVPAGFATPWSTADADRSGARLWVA